MLNRKQFHYSVQLQGSDGKIYDFPVDTYWSPEKEGTVEAVMAAAKGMAFWQTNKTLTYAPISATQK